ncbi:PREDICTED: uncharacterized protein LOC109581854 [Amphimedon queenslandica]|uniref:Myb-like domain-containing protein n=2 Tax=Amphimedon queenslandica TaxID=400682 RepID=A0AAN0J599_AMPQE|nr:PREDICTED: uncharacterized protein LOC109581854 [Amphimedon queenslandica]|eukprot:XP_019851888.1 PREDICTED: uncharacterized protein LOC109581854 [Amphimedon queenslandica]
MAGQEVDANISVIFNVDVKVLHTMAQKLCSDIKTKGPGFTRSPDNLQVIIDNINEVVSGMSATGEDPFLKHINVLLCELKVLRIILVCLEDINKLEEEIENLGILADTSMPLYLENYLRKSAERESLEIRSKKITEVTEEYVAKVERTLEKLCAFLKENIVEETMETEQKNDDPVSNDSNDATPTESSSSSSGVNKSVPSTIRQARPYKFGMGKSRIIWSHDAVAALVDGVNTFGVGKWKKILQLESASSFPTHTTNTKLYDKWRNLVKYSHVEMKDGKWIIKSDSK